MKWVLYIIAAVLFLAGSVFALQGLSFLPSQVMYGKQEWVVIGGAMVIVGGALIVFTNLRTRRSAMPEQKTDH